MARVGPAQLELHHRRRCDLCGLRDGNLIGRGQVERARQPAAQDVTRGHARFAEFGDSVGRLDRRVLRVSARRNRGLAQFRHIGRRLHCRGTDRGHRGVKIACSLNRHANARQCRGAEAG